MISLIARSSLVAQYRLMVCALMLSVLWAAIALMGSVREHAALIQARAAADIVQALILQGDTYRLQSNVVPENVASWRLIYPGQRSNDRFELAAVAAFFGQSAATAAAAPTERQRELYVAEDGVRLLYATRLRGPREEDMLFSLDIRMPSAVAMNRPGSSRHLRASI